LKINKPIIIFGDHTRVVKYIDFDFIVGADGVKIIEPKIDEKFAYYSLLYASTKIENRGYSRHFGILQKFSFPLPPLAEQERIVEKIEQIFALIDRIEVKL